MCDKEETSKPYSVTRPTLIHVISSTKSKQTRNQISFLLYNKGFKIQGLIYIKSRLSIHCFRQTIEVANTHHGRRKRDGNLRCASCVFQCRISSVEEAKLDDQNPQNSKMATPEPSFCSSMLFWHCMLAANLLTQSSLLAPVSSTIQPTQTQIM